MLAYPFPYPSLQVQENSLTRYSLGLIFSVDYDSNNFREILLLKKKKPPSQAGRYNGVGGHFEEGEDWRSCIVRETEEETTLSTSPQAWRRVGAFYKPETWIVHVAFTYVLPETLRGVPPLCDEGTFLIASIHRLPPNVMTSIRWLIPLIQGLDQERQREFLITYLPDKASEDEEEEHATRTAHE